MLDPSVYKDTFARDHLPPEDLWPKCRPTGLSSPIRST